MSEFYAVDYKNGKLGILDRSDSIVEYYTPKEIKSFLGHGISINGVSLAEGMNPIYTLDGLTVNLAYRTSKVFGNWTVSVLRKGDRYGLALTAVAEDDLVFFYDSSVNLSKTVYPYGQFVASYYLKTILGHRGYLCLDMDVPKWTVSSNHMNSIVEWLRSIKKLEV